jgi:hypothetical protein
LLLFGLAVLGMLPVWALIALSLVNGGARAAQMPTSQAMAANLVPKESLLNALSLSASTQHGSRLIGPGLVTPLVSLLGAASGFFLCFVFYAGGLVHILSLSKRAPSGGAKESFAANFMGGLNYVYLRPVLRFIIVIGLFHCALTMAFESLLPAFSNERLTGSASGFGTLMMGVGVGAFISSVLVSGGADITGERQHAARDGPAQRGGTAPARAHVCAVAGGRCRGADGRCAGSVHDDGAGGNAVDSRGRVPRPRCEH